MKEINFNFNMVKNIDTIIENKELFLELLSVSYRNEDFVISFFEKWQKDRKEALEDEEKIEKINSLYLDAINYIKQIDSYRVLRAFDSISYEYFAGAIRFFDDLIKKDILFYVLAEREYVQNLETFIINSGYAEPEVYKSLIKQYEDLYNEALNYKNSQK